MEQQRFPVEDGAVTCRPVGDRLEVQAALPGPGEGLYRAYLRGESGKQLDLGTLLPQGNGRRLQRSLPIAELKRRGCWPVTGAGVTLSYAFQRPQAQGMNQPPKGWHKSEQAAARFPNDPVLAQAVRAAGPCPGVGVGAEAGVSSAAGVVLREGGAGGGPGVGGLDVFGGGQAGGARLKV